MPAVVLTSAVLVAFLGCTATWLQDRGGLTSLQPTRLWNWFAISFWTFTGVFVLFLGSIP